MAIPILPAPSTKFTFVWKDVEGRTRTTVFYAPYALALGDVGSPGDGSAITIMATVGDALQALTNANFVHGTISQEYGFGGVVGANAQYPSNRQKMVLHFINSYTGDNLQWELPAPKVANFISGDEETVLLAVGQGVATAMNSTAVSTKDGTPNSGIGWVYVRGYLVEKHASKALSPGYSTELGGE